MNVPTVRLGEQLVVHRRDVAADVVDVGARDAGEVAMGEHPGRSLAVELLPLLGMLGEVAVVGPQVRRRAHHQRADPADEHVPAAVVLGVRHFEQPVQGVVLVGDETVEGAGGEVHDAAHAIRR